MSKEEMQQRGPLGLDGTEWTSFTVDGDGDGRIRHSDPADSAATLARMIWSRGGLRAGLFSHNQAEWYVEAVLAEAQKLEGHCKKSEVEWTLALPNVVMAPINWNNLTLSNELEKEDLEQGRIDPRIVGLLGAITQTHEITISALRSDHSMTTTEGYVSNHYYGRAMDIAVVDGVSCTDTAPTAPCGELAHDALAAAGAGDADRADLLLRRRRAGPRIRPQRPLRSRPRRLRRLSFTARVT